MKPLAIGRRLFPIKHPVIPQHTRNPQPIVLEHLRSSHRLSRAMRLQRSPSLNSLLVAPEGKR